MDRQSPTTTPARLRALLDRMWRSPTVQRPVVRWGLALAAGIALGAAGYWTATSVSPTGVRFLGSQRSFSSEDLIKICRELDREHIQYKVDDQRRIKVAAEQFDQADASFAKLDVGPHSIDEIRGGSSGWGLLETPQEREQREKLAREKILEGLIGRLDGVVWSLVSIHRPATPAWRHANAKPSAFVYVETEANRPLPSQTVQSIPVILAGYEPDLTPGSIRLMDRRGNKYLDPGDPALGDKSRNRAREEKLREEILEKLDWIKGVRVQVRVSGPRATTVATADTASKQPGPRQTNEAGPIASPEPRPGSGGSRSTMLLNRPLQLEPEPKPVSKPPAPEGPALAVENRNPSTPALPVLPGEREGQQGRVLIHVPRSFYYYYNADIRSDDREPSREDLHAMVERTEKQIRTAVSLVIREPEAWKVDIDTIPDEVSLNRPVALSSAADARRRYLDWGIVGAAGALVSILFAIGSWIQVVRRPARLPEPTQPSRHYHVDSASEPGPSERVRELIRRNPEAAASVLERWVGQGGRRS
jgi:hypothetical protein